MARLGACRLAIESEAETDLKTAHLWPAWAILNLGTFGAGLVLPLVTVSHLYVFNSDIVLFRVPLILAENGEWLLAAAVAFLGIALPVFKTLAYVFAPYWPRIALFVGRFSPVAFFDIFMVALLIFVAKGAFASNAATAAGMYPLLFFACSSKLIEWAFARSFARSAGREGS
jgi:uncharacterized paraquat-inducible protein A